SGCSTPARRITRPFIKQPSYRNSERCIEPAVYHDERGQGARGKRKGEKRAAAVLQPLSPGEARVNVVPPLDMVFAVLPAEKNDAVLAQVGEVAQAAVEILDLHSQTEDGLRVIGDAAERGDVADARGSAAAFGSALAGHFDLRLEPAQHVALFLNFFKQVAQLRQQRVGFLDREKFHD